MKTYRLDLILPRSSRKLATSSQVMPHYWVIADSLTHMPTGETECPLSVCLAQSDTTLPSPSTLDVVFAAHTHLLMNVSFTDPLLQALLSESYPSLVAHAKAVQSAAFPDPQSFPPTVPLDPSVSLRSLLPVPTLRLWSSKKQKEELTEAEKKFRRARWGWIGLAVASVAFYVAFLRPTIVFVVRDDSGTGEEENDEDVEEDEHDGGGAQQDEEEELLEEQEEDE